MSDQQGHPQSIPDDYNPYGYFWIALCVYTKYLNGSLQWLAIDWIFDRHLQVKQSIHKAKQNNCLPAQRHESKVFLLAIIS